LAENAEAGDPVIEGRMQVRYTARDTGDADEWRDAAEQNAQPAAQLRTIQVAPIVELLQLIGAFSNEQLSSALVTAIGNQAVAVELIRLLGLTRTELVDAAAICCSALRDELITYEQARVALDAVNSGISVRDAFTDADVIYEELFSFGKNARARQWRAPVIPSSEDKPEPKKARWKYASKTAAPQEPPLPEIDDSLVLDEALQLGDSQPSPGPLTLDDFDPESIPTVPSPKKKKKPVPAAADQGNDTSEQPAPLEMAPTEPEPIELSAVEFKPVELEPVALSPVELASVELAPIQFDEAASTSDLAVEPADAASAEDLSVETAAVDVASLTPAPVAIPAAAVAHTADSAGNVLARVMANWRQQNAAQQQGQSNSSSAPPATARGATSEFSAPPPAKPEPVEQNFEPTPELAPPISLPRADDESVQEHVDKPSSFFERMKERMQKIRPRVVIVADQPVDPESLHRSSPSAPKAEAQKKDAEPQAEETSGQQHEQPEVSPGSQQQHEHPEEHEHPEASSESSNDQEEQSGEFPDSRSGDLDDSGLPPNTVTRADGEEKEGVDTLTQTGEGFDAFVATGEGFEPFVATGEGFEPFVASGESEAYSGEEDDAMTVTGDGFEAFQATGEQTAVKTADGKVPRKAAKRPKTRRERKRKK
jgi:hypothetical protein